MCDLFMGKARVTDWMQAQPSLPGDGMTWSVVSTGPYMETLNTVSNYAIPKAERSLMTGGTYNSLHGDPPTFVKTAPLCLPHQLRMVMCRLSPYKTWVGGLGTLSIIGTRFPGKI